MKYTIILLIFLCLTFNLWSQVIIEANIVGSANNQPVPFATILVRGKSTSFSDEKGKFRITCNSSDSIKISCVGYKAMLESAQNLKNQKIIKLTELIIPINEVTVTAESAFSMLARANDSTQNRLKKRIRGICKRQDIMTNSQQKERSTNANISFITTANKNGKYKSKYWLNDLQVKMDGVKSDYPYLAYPNSIPFNVYSVKELVKENSNVAKCTISFNSDDKLIIKIALKKVNKNFLNEIYYHINKDSWIIEKIEGKGNHWNRPVNSLGKQFYKAELELNFQNTPDSCLIKEVNSVFIFSRKRESLSNTHKYIFRMNIRELGSDELLNTQGPVLKKRKEYLLFRDE